MTVRQISLRGGECCTGQEGRGGAGVALQHPRSLLLG